MVASLLMPVLLLSLLATPMNADPPDSALAPPVTQSADQRPAPIQDNFKSGLQVVPGVSAPIGVGPSRGQRSLFVYLSLEHPLWRPF